MDITLIIPAHNEEAYIGGCLDAAMRYGKGKLKEVIVVDNASTDRTAEIASTYARVRVVREPQKGLTHARQAGLDASQSEFVAFMDADCRMTPQWCETIERHLGQRPEVVSLTGPIRYYDGSLHVRRLAVPLQWLALPAARFLAGFIVVGGNFVARRSSLNAVGGFDRGIAFYGEDADIARRLSAHGQTLLKMDLVLETSARRLTSEGVARTYAAYALNFLWHTLFGRSFTHVYTDARS